MVSTNAWRIIALAAALLSLALNAGCIFVDAQFELAPDGTRHGRIEAGVMQGVGEENGSFTVQMQESLAPGKWRELPEETRGQWLVKTLVGEAGPGESLFTPDAEPQPQFASASHLLSTEFTFTMDLPEMGELGPGVEANGPEADQAEGGVQIEGMDEALAGMMTLMMSSGEAGLRFSVRLPGEIVATNGEILAVDRAGWSIPLSGPTELPELTATSRLLNWPNIGRLGGQLTAVGRPELVLALIAAVRRGVVPDPVTEDPLAAPLDVQTYMQALEIMNTLDAAVGPEISTDVMRTMGLGGATADPALVAQVAARLQGVDLPAEVDAEVTQWLLERLGGH